MGMRIFKREFDYATVSRRIFAVLEESDLPQQTIFKRLLQIAVESVAAEGGALVTYAGSQLVVRECLGWESFSFRTEECRPFIHWLKREREVVSRQRLLHDRELTPVKRAGLAFFVQFQAEICLPLIVNQRFCGFITLVTAKGRRADDAEMIKILSWLGLQFGLVLQNVDLQASVNHLQMQLNEFDKLKAQMLANLSHELRTPLTGVIGFTELLQEEVDGSLNEAQRGHVDAILQSSNKLLRILSTLVHLARLESGSMAINVQQFHLAPVVGSLLNELHLNDATQIDVEVTRETPRIYGDLTLVRQIFKHLLDNAAKYTAKGKITVSAVKKGEMLEVQIKDTGIGIDREKLDMIFEGFFQADGGLNRHFEGTGLGLTVTKKLVELHGGRLRVQSRPGRGSSFYFTLPLKPTSIRFKELAA